jgi:type IV pilus assembly protein PilW
MHTNILATRRQQKGLSLIELMISITIGMLILASLTTLFVNQSRTRTELDKSTRMIENGRYALEILSDNLRLAGFYGESDNALLALPGALTDPCSTTIAQMAAMLRIYVGGFDAASVGSSIATPPCGFTTLKNGSDILVLQRANTTPVAQTAAVNGVHYIQTSSCALDLEKIRFDTVPANFTRRRKGCTGSSTTPYADVRRFIIQTYFVSTDNNPGDGIPTLKRRELDPAGTGTFVTTPLVEGIEYFQVEYGIDGVDTNADSMPDRFNPYSVTAPAPSDIDGAPDAYSTCAACSIAQWANVVSVKIYVITRNIEQTPGYNDDKIYTLGQAGVFGPFNDKYKRRVYTQVIRLINPSSRREVQ